MVKSWAWVEDGTVFANRTVRYPSARSSAARPDSYTKSHPLRTHHESSIVPILQPLLQTKALSSADGPLRHFNKVTCPELSGQPHLRVCGHGRSSDARCSDLQTVENTIESRKWAIEVCSLAIFQMQVEGAGSVIAAISALASVSHHAGDVGGRLKVFVVD